MPNGTKKRPKKTGLPRAITKPVLRKLEKVFAYGGTDAEAAFYAGIGESTLYDNCQKNQKFSERKQVLKLNPILKARETIFKSLDNPKTAMWYLERRAKAEFGGDVKDEIEQYPVALVKFIGDDGKETDN